ncbi:MAG: pirin family protein [Litorivicinaceae bacterium]|nr:pirin family protein [Litorivicinaceae bacterium]MDP5340551.1 pirin family protein [Litorivicinaceae bacterium]MDP5344311.1 pirin family protein [Litorivicinaceae bacterium]
MEREIVRVVRGRHVTDGAGVNICRVIGIPGADYVDPFLMLDDFRNDDPDGYIAGFPPHPHRGFETVTYMLKGRMRHRDSAGNQGLLEGGSVQWMTAGRGILHSEMPEQTDGAMWGFQLWLNLPQRDQMAPPGYQDIPADQITEFEHAGTAVRLVAGDLFDQVGPAKTFYPVVMADLSVPEGETVRVPLPEGDTTIAFCFAGELRVGDRVLVDGDLAMAGRQGDLVLRGGSGGGRVLILSAKPLGESIARHGPFVLATDQELRQAFLDYQMGVLAPNQAAFLATGGRG